MLADPVSLDPRFVVDQEGDLVVGALFEPLVRLDERFRVQPGAAASWTVSDDGTQFTFELRQAAFHDGTPVRAGDFVRTFERIATTDEVPVSPLGFLLERVARDESGRIDVTADGPRTLSIRTAEPDPGFLVTLAHPGLVPVPVWAERDPAGFEEQPVGNGPFRMNEPRERGSFIRLSAWEGHWRDPGVDEILFSVYADDGHRRQWQDLADGQLHVGIVGPENLEAAVDRFGQSVDGYRGPGVLGGITTTVYLYAFDTTREPYDDVRVRRAISLSIDRRVLADDVMGGTRAPADALVPPPIPGSQPGVCDHCRLDRAEARALWEEAEVELDVIRLTHPRGAIHAAIAERMAADIELALDVDVELRGMDLQTFVRTIHAGEASLFRLGWEPTEPDMGAYLGPLFHSSYIGLDNLTGYADPEVDAMLDEAREATRIGTRIARYRDVEARVLDDVPVIPLLYYRQTVVVAEQVEGLVWPANGRVDFTSVVLDGG